MNVQLGFNQESIIPGITAATRAETAENALNAEFLQKARQRFEGTPAVTTDLTSDIHFN